jgi:serine/threonine-protein kinase
MDPRATPSADAPSAPVPPDTTAPAPAGPPADALPSGNPPAHAGRCELRGEIGRGGMGAVLLGRDPELDRPLAVKVLLADRAGDAGLERRFLAEAQICGRLQHPGVVPVYDVGRLDDGRPFFTMKLVKGRTLADLLAARPTPADGLPQWVGVFEQVCQAVAYAHSRGVIHRDLKPGNVMVGEFGEVQVMDWGLAKVLTGEAPPPPAVGPAPPRSTIYTVRTADPDGRSHAGTVLGTPAYMAPEQARGEVDVLDARADVFGLGAVLCEILTGRPPYVGRDPTEVQTKAVIGDQEDALARLAACGADAELAALAKACLHPNRERRPADGAAVAAAVTAYRRSVEERLRAAELARGEEKAKALRGRQRRRWALALAASVLVTLAVLGGGAWRLSAQRGERERAAAAALDEADRFRDRDAWADALTAARRAGDVLASGDSAALRDRAARTRTDAETALRLEEIELRRAGRMQDGHYDYARAEADYAAAFRDYGIDLAALDPDQAAERVRASALRDTLTAALDQWSRINLETDAEGCARLLAIAAKADPDPWRRRFRVPAVLSDRRALEELAGRPEAAGQPPAVVALLGDALARAGAVNRAVEVLRDAQQRRPDSFWLNHELAYYLVRLRPPEREKAVGYYRAALSLRPESPGVWNNLGVELHALGRHAEAEAAYRKAVDLQPDYFYAWNNLGNALSAQAKGAPAEEALRKALEVWPDYPEAHNNLSAVLQEQGRCVEAEAEARKAVKLAPKMPQPRLSLALALEGQGKLDEAVEAAVQAVEAVPGSSLGPALLGRLLERQEKLDEAADALRKAHRLDPDDIVSLARLGGVLSRLGRRPEAIEAFHEAVALAPDDAATLSNLSLLLAESGQTSEAVAAGRRAVRLAPGDGVAHKNYGVALHRSGDRRGAVAEYREAIRLRPNDAQAHSNLGGSLVEEDPDAAVVECLRAIELDSNQAGAFVNLGRARSKQGKPKEAADAYRKGLALQPKNAVAEYWLGIALERLDQKEEAIAAYRRSTVLDPNNPSPFYNAGVLLAALDRDAEAVDAYRAAVHLKPDFEFAQCNLGLAQEQLGRHDEAETSFRRALELDADDAYALCGLGRALTAQGRFADAVVALRRGDELGRNSPAWNDRSAGWLRQVERLARLDARLPRILEGEKPADAAEALGLAGLCQQYKRLYGAGARLYAEAFAARPALADDPAGAARYNAACCAALAAAGQGDDAPREEKEQARLRRQAHEWLRADLAARAERLKGGGAEERGQLAKMLQAWKEDDDLAGVRDKDALDKLPEAERDDWRKLWADVDALLQKAAPPE